MVGLVGEQRLSAIAHSSQPATKDGVQPQEQIPVVVAEEQCVGFLLSNLPPKENQLEYKYENVMSDLEQTRHNCGFTIYCLKRLKTRQLTHAAHV